MAGDSAIKLNNDNLALELFGTLNEKNPQNVEYSLPIHKYFESRQFR